MADLRGYPLDILRKLDGAKISERNREIAKMALSGNTYKAVGEMFGLSQERVRSIMIISCRRAEQSFAISESKRYMRPQKFPEYLELSVRATNCLKYFFGTEEDLRKILSTREGAKELMRSTPNFGKASLTEVYKALGIEDPGLVGKNDEIKTAVKMWESGDISADAAMQKIRTAT